MVRAILSGAKTQTRRVVKAPRVQASPRGTGPMLFDLNRAWKDASWAEQHGEYLHIPYCHPSDGWDAEGRDCSRRFWCPFAAPGSRLWVRETWALMCREADPH